jgi:hypothetical protein
MYSVQSRYKMMKKKNEKKDAVKLMKNVNVGNGFHYGPQNRLFSLGDWVNSTFSRFTKLLPSCLLLN